MVKIQNIINQVVGDDITILASVKDNTKNPVDLTGATSIMTIKASVGDTDGQALSQTSGVFVTDGTDGQIEFNVPNSHTSNADASIKYVYDAQVTFPNGRKYTILKGELSFLNEVTQS